MKDDRKADFFEDEFKNQNKELPWLCQTIRRDGIGTATEDVPENTMQWLNDLLGLPGLFDRIMSAKPSLDLTEEIIKLRDRTATARSRVHKATSDAGEISDSEKKAIMRLNRLTIELAYPVETPKSGYELTALVRTKEGENLLCRYTNLESFRKDMKGRRSDIQWGILVRCDEGKVVDDYFSRLGDRDKISLIDTEPKDLKQALEVLTPHQQALRDAAVRRFKTNKVKGYIAQQIKHLNTSRQIGEAIGFLLDKQGRPPAHLPLEDIIGERQDIEAQMHWLEAICEELRNNLSKIKEIEDSALLLMAEIETEND